MAFNLNKLARGRIFWVILVFIIALLSAVYLIVINIKIQLPASFIEARQNAAATSREIVDLTGATNEKIKAANLFDLSGDPNGAYNLIQEARAKNRLAYDQAFKLSRELKQMAESLGAIASLKSQRLAYEAVASELSLVSEFITYTQNLNSFLEALSRAVQTNNSADRQAIADYLGEVNKNAVKINELNSEFLERMNVFETSL